MVDLEQSVRGGVVMERRDDGVVDRFHADGTITREQDVTDILDMNAIERGEDRFRGFRLAPTFRKVASIPVAAVDIAAHQGMDILHDPDAMRRFLNDPANAAFRTSLGNA